MAHVSELPGCFIWAKTQKKALSRLPRTISDFLVFLKRNGEKGLRVPGHIELEVVETQKGTCPVWSGSKAALFSYDLIPPTNDLVKKCLRWMRYNRVELLSGITKLPEEVLDWKPDKETRSIRETLNHLANVEWWYLSRLRDFKELYLVEDYPVKKIFEKLKKIRQIAVKILKNLTPADRERINIPKKYATYKDEKWAARKVLRRFLEHEREHIETIAKTLKLYKKLS